MTDNVQKVTYFVCNRPNKPGEGAHLLKQLKEEGVNLYAFHGFPSGRRAQVDLVPEDAALFRKVSKKLGIELEETKTGFLVRGKDRVGAIVEMLEKLAAADINITAIDAVTAGAGRFGAIFWVKPQDVTRTAKLLGV
jgi:prephenate dehydratase